MKTKFPNWGYIHYNLVNNLEKNHKIKYNFSLMKETYLLLDKLLKENLDLGQITEELTKTIGFSSSLTKDNQPHTFKNIEEIQDWPSQFSTIYNYKQKDFSYVDENIKKTLNISPEKFTMAAFTGQDPDNKHYHPEDIFHFFRYALLGYFQFSLLGHGLDISKLFITLKFRMRIPEYKNNEYF